MDESLSFLFLRNEASTNDNDSLGIEATDPFIVIKGFFFIGTVWLFGKVFGMFHGKLIGEILAGFILQGFISIRVHFAFLRIL
jgi:hypothetical protein